MLHGILTPVFELVSKCNKVMHRRANLEVFTAFHNSCVSDIDAAIDEMEDEELEVDEEHLTNLSTLIYSVMEHLRAMSTSLFALASTAYGVFGLYLCLVRCLKKIEIVYIL